MFLSVAEYVCGGVISLKYYFLKLISSFPLFFPTSPCFSSAFSPPPYSLQFDLIHMVSDKLAAKDLGKVSRCPVKKSHQGVHFFPFLHITLLSCTVGEK